MSYYFLTLCFYKASFHFEAWREEKMSKLYKWALAVSFVAYSGWAHAGTREFGDYLRIMVPVYALGMTATETDYEGVKQLTYSVASAQMTSELLKIATQEKRPDYEDGDKKNSFPSGHATGAFSAAMFIHKRYGFKQSVVPYMLAGITGYSRIEAKRHHFHDVLGGAVIAGIYTWVFVDEKQNMSFECSPGFVRIGYKVDL
jgi:membrane-associated phospholipid phosphatase